jgi:HK97 family phage major capsid protein
MAKEFRASAEVEQLIAAVQAQVDALKAKWDATDPTPDEVTTMNDLISQLESLAQEQQLASAEERLQKVTAEMQTRAQEPKREAPKFTVPAEPKKAVTAGEVFRLTLANAFGESTTAEQHYRMQRAGISLSRNAKLPVDFSLLNGRKRKHYRTLSKGANPGNDLPFATYSDKVLELMSYASPLLTVLDIENDPNGNEKTYFNLDDTGNSSTDITASGGTEITPTIPDKDVSDSELPCNVFGITSGYQKATRQILRDSFVSLEGKFAEWSANRHARKMEDDILNASGNGDTGRMGLLHSISNSNLSGGHWTIGGLKNFVYGFPIQYRANLTLVVSPATYGDMNVDLVNDVGDSFFGTLVQDDIEYQVLLGKKIFVSEYMDDDMLLGFVPEHFVVRTVDGQSFDTLTEKFYPNVAYCSLMEFGSLWRGPSTTRKTLSLTS